MYFMKSSIFQNTTENFDRFLPYVLQARNLSNFSVVFWKIDDKYILTLSDLYDLANPQRGIEPFQSCFFITLEVNEASNFMPKILLFLNCTLQTKHNVGSLYCKNP